MARLLEVRNLETQFTTAEAIVSAVNDVSFDVQSGKVLGIVGESGCGKSVTAQSVLQILGHSGSIVNGEIIFYPEGGGSIDLAKLDPKGPEIRLLGVKRYP